MDEPGQKARLDVNRAHSARMYDYFLGGKDSYEADRVAAEGVKAVWPSVVMTARINRAFMNRATRWLAGSGVRQFLDIGTGIPTEPNLHQIAQEVAPDARVVYVDNDPIVLAHARALMVGTPEGRTAYVEADVTRPETILDAAELAEVLDLSQPVALSVVALLHFVPDDRDPHGILATLLDRLAPGSYLVMTHISADFGSPDVATAMRIYNDSGVPVQMRSRAEVARFFEGLELVEPGLTVPHRWRNDGIEVPASMDAQVSLYAAVGRKR